MALNKKAELLGHAGEQATSKLLISRGYRILDRNWRIKEGELDVVALSPNNEIVFVEVKTRTSNDYGDPLEAISAAKLHRLQRLALAWLATNQRLGSTYRIDVSGVLLGRSGELSIDYREDIS
jgi:putative endonuclease